jgi:hypothetical protein
MVSGPVPPLESITVCEAETVPALMVAKTMLLLESVACGTGPVDVPVSVSVCGELDALSVVVMTSKKVPTDCGVKVTLMLQKEPDASTDPLLHVETIVKFVLSENAMLLRVAETVPVLRTVIVCTALV